MASSASRLPVRSSSGSSKRSSLSKVSLGASAASSKPDDAMRDVDIGIDDDSGDDERTDTQPQLSQQQRSSSRTAVRRSEHHHHRLPQQQQAEEKEEYTKGKRTVTRDTEEDSSAVFSSHASAPLLSSYDPSVLTVVSSLQQQLEQKEQELQQLSEALLLLQTSSSSSHSSASTPTAAMVKDMMRKQRELHLQLSRERQRHAQEMAALRQQLDTASSACSAAGSPSSSSCSSPLLTSLQQEVTTLTSRLSSARLQSSQLKQRMARMQAVIEREVGDVEAVAAVLATIEVKEGDDDGEREEKRRERQPASAAAAADGSGWKGRAERVKELERKVAALERRLKDQQHRPAPSPLSSSSPDRKEEVEALRRQLEQSAKAASELTAARKMQRSRVSALEAEMAEMKDRLLTLLGKSDKDDLLLDQLSLSLRHEKAERERQTAEADCRQREQQQRIAQLTAQLEQAEAQRAQYRLVAETVEAVAAGEREGEQRQHRLRTEALESCISALQQRCDELDRDRAQGRSAKTETKDGADGRDGRRQERGAGGRAQQPQQPPLDAGERTSDVRRRLLEMVAERELIRESYAAMLARRDEEMEKWKEIRQHERQEESRTRQAIKGRIDQLLLQLQMEQ